VWCVVVVVVCGGGVWWCVVVGEGRVEGLGYMGAWLGQSSGQWVTGDPSHPTANKGEGGGVVNRRNLFLFVPRQESYAYNHTIITRNTLAYKIPQG
jgi:hypothetical protein